MSYPVPVDECDRLATLQDYRVLDTAPDSRFDDLVAIASAHFQVPVALVSLIDADRQWFKARIGLERRETRRQDSFCNHAILEPDRVMVVEDALTDGRFRDNPLVTGDPNIRFYAGAPIVVEGGAALGAVCVIDREPRRFGDDDRQMLARLARNARALLDLHRRNALLHDAARRDPLTGLANRRGLDRMLATAVAGALEGRSCGLLVCDLDRFKQINDSFGHDCGDALLIEAARRLTHAVRSEDLVARIGGDEFLILLRHPICGESLDLIARRVVAAFSDPIVHNGRAHALGVSVGGALCPRDAALADDLYREADRALYVAKRAGRGQYRIAGAGEAQRDAGAGIDAAALEQAIERDALFVEWQAVRDLRHGTIVAYEALVRWRHPDLGVIEPSRFVPLAEAAGMALRLDSWVLFRATEEAALAPSDRAFGINLSAQSLANPNIVSMVQMALSRSALAPERLTLEITEGTPIGDEEAALRHIHAFKAMGIRLALDDFGTGYSTLASLQRYPFDLVKLDKGFVGSLGSDGDARGTRMLRGVVALAGLLDIGLIAEGIETADQAELLRDTGCTMGQGFYWDRPAQRPWTLSPVLPVVDLDHGAGHSLGGGRDKVEQG